MSVTTCSAILIIFGSETGNSGPRQFTDFFLRRRRLRRRRRRRGFIQMLIIFNGTLDGGISGVVTMS